MAKRSNKTESTYDPEKHKVLSEVSESMRTNEHGETRKVLVRIRQYENFEPKLTFESTAGRAFLKIPESMWAEVRDACDKAIKARTTKARKSA